MIGPRDTLGAYFLKAARNYPDRIFVQQPDSAMTYREAVIRVAATAHKLSKLGVRRGDVVAAYLEDQIPTLFFDLACFLTGIVPSPLSPVFSAEYFVSELVTQLDAKAVFTTERLAPQLIARGLRPLAYVSSPETALPGIEPLEEHPNWSFGQALDYLETLDANITSKDLMIIAPTSGSTGRPKFVIRRHMACARYAHFVGDRILARSEPNQPHRFLLIAALTHAFGLHMLATALRLGATLLVTNRIDTASELEEVRAMDPTILAMVPRVQRSYFHQYLSKGGNGRIFGPSAKFACCAGGTPTAEALLAMQDQGVEILEFYGSTEASIVALSPPGTWRPRSGGLPVPDAEVTTGPDGEILVRSPGVMPGYFGDESLNEAAFTAEGFYKTGDFGEITTDGRVRILGRKRDVFNTPEGSNIYPERIENSIEALPCVRQVILVGDQRPYLAALVVLEDDNTELEDVTKRTGYLPELIYRDAYQKIGLLLEQVNAKQERIERVVRFALFARSFPEPVYAFCGPGKARRDRKAAAEHYKMYIDSMYRADPLDDATFVPGTDRRLRPRAGNDPASKDEGSNGESKDKEPRPVLAVV